MRQHSVSQQETVSPPREDASSNGPLLHRTDQTSKGVYPLAHQGLQSLQHPKSPLESFSAHGLRDGCRLPVVVFRLGFVLLPGSLRLVPGLCISRIRVVHRGPSLEARDVPSDLWGDFRLSNGSHPLHSWARKALRDGRVASPLHGRKFETRLVKRFGISHYNELDFENVARFGIISTRPPNTPFRDQNMKLYADMIQLFQQEDKVKPQQTYFHTLLPQCPENSHINAT